MAQPVLVIGGTRATGLHVVDVLRRGGHPVRVLARNPPAVRGELFDGVEIVRGDLTKPQTLIPALHGVAHIVVTAGVRSGRPARDSTVRATEHDGILSTIAAARTQDFAGRLVYLTSIGAPRSSLFAVGLDIWKGNTLVWRRRAEDAIRSSGFDYAIVRAAFLLNRPGGSHEICVTQKDPPLTLREFIGRADVAEVLVAAAFHPRASRVTLEVRWCGKPRRTPWDGLFADLRPDQLRRAV